MSVKVAKFEIKRHFFPYILIFLLYKTNRFHVAVSLFSNRSQRTSKCGKNISDTLGCASCVTFLFLPHFDVICDLLGNLRNDDEGTTTTLHIRGRLDRGFRFRRENLKVKRTILREDDGILGGYTFCLSMAFKDLRNSLIISYDDGFIDDEEFVLLYDLYSSKDLDFPMMLTRRLTSRKSTKLNVWQSFVFVKETYELWQTFYGFQIP